MDIIQLIDEYTPFLLFFFVVGSVLSLIQEIRKYLPEKTKKMLKLLEWCLLPPGFAALFVAAQQQSVRYFALYPNTTIAACVAIISLCGVLIFLKAKKLMLY